MMSSLLLTLNEKESNGIDNPLPTALIKLLLLLRHSTVRATYANM